ncbi:MAG: response regulator, partial [Planctomycetota bacterium]
MTADSTHNPSGSRVLIVDDDEAHAEALADGLEIDGYRCVLVDSGQAAIAKMEEDGRFDAVLTDLVMASVGGLEVLGAAVRLQPDAAVLLVTGHGSVETAVDAMRQGASDYIEKPVRLNELRTRLGRAIETRQLRRVNRELREQLDR